ncbi:serine O-acetyltransferase [Algoriphagus sp. PAP.12]|uniref:serine O-acetyltransferase n=1 Tax=Algoriphagus sp. PAP.12 TaxID=2996678 RepID=UPI00227CE6D6|nr:serine acetyltransferase [Algoriphagus sp. PAP.12]
MIFKRVRSDLFRCSGKIDYKSFCFRLLFDKGFKFIFFFRYSSKFKRTTPLGFILYFFYKRYSVKYGFQIPTSVVVGPGLSLPHFGGIVINSKAKIGSNCNILQGVTIGNVKNGKKKGTPVIGNNVFLGPNAVIVGGISVGNNVLVSGNSFITENVPDNSLVFGNPARILVKDFPSLPYLHNSIQI